MNSSFLSDLSASQTEAVRYCDGAELVIAGAGSGKTRVLTYKIAYLLSRGMQPQNILALTFTNKAANEMKQRIAALIDADSARWLQMGTFHSVFCRILRAEAGRLGFTSNFTIYDETDSKSLLNAIIKDLGYDSKLIKAATIKGFISMAKNRLERLDDYVQSRRMWLESNPEYIGCIERIGREYAVRCKNANAMDFDDLLSYTYMLLNEQPDVREKYANRFLYVLVDEYQDTNLVQQKIITLLTEKHQHICLVGDDAQSIYAFRGANLDYMLNFQRNNDYRIFKLEQNYRSTQNIVNAANSLIKHNQRQIQKDVFSNKGVGEPLILKPTLTDREEAIVVCQGVKRLMRQHSCAYNDIAVLYRTNAQSRSLEEEFRHQEIPYRIYGGLSFYQRKEIKDIIAYMRVIVNSSDDEALRRIINYPARGIGATTLQKLSAMAAENDRCMFDMISPKRLAQVPVSKATQQKLAAFHAMIEDFKRLNDTLNAYEFGKIIIEKTGILDDIKREDSVESTAKRENLDELLVALNAFVEDKKAEESEQVWLADFLGEVSLLSDLDFADSSEDSVSLMTMHAAKGLEFRSVFIVGLEENIIPSQRTADSARAVEEERRLLYVAITRAKEHCHLSYAQSRYRYGTSERSLPSRFLKDIAPEYIRVEGRDDFWGGNTVERPWQKHAFGSIPTARLQPVDTFSRQSKYAFRAAIEAFERGNMQPLRSQKQTANRAEATEFGIKVGSVVEHTRFGRGVVKTIEGSGENTKASVEFRNGDVKQLLLKFARFTVVQH